MTKNVPDIQPEYCVDRDCTAILLFRLRSQVSSSTGRYLPILTSRKQTLQPPTTLVIYAARGGPKLPTLYVGPWWHATLVFGGFWAHDLETILADVYRLHQSLILFHQPLMSKKITVIRPSQMLNKQQVLIYSTANSITTTINTNTISPYGHITIRYNRNFIGIDIDLTR